MSETPETPEALPQGMAPQIESANQPLKADDSAMAKRVMKIILCIGCISVWCCGNFMAFLLLPRSVSIWVMLGGCYFMWQLWRRDSDHLLREHERSIKEILPGNNPRQ